MNETEESSPVNTRRCPNCGAFVDASAPLCPNCGAVRPTPAQQFPLPISYDIPEIAVPTLTSSVRSDETLGILTPFIMSFLASSAALLAQGQFKMQQALLAVPFSFPGVILSLIVWAALRRRYPAYGDGLRKSLKVIGIFFGVVILVLLGLMAICFVGLYVVNKK